MCEDWNRNGWVKNDWGFEERVWEMNGFQVWEFKIERDIVIVVVVVVWRKIKERREEKYSKKWNGKIKREMQHGWFTCLHFYFFHPSYIENIFFISKIKPKLNIWNSNLRDTCNSLKSIYYFEANIKINSVFSIKSIQLIDRYARISIEVRVYTSTRVRVLIHGRRLTYF